MNIFSEKIPTNLEKEIKHFIKENFEAAVSPKDYAFWQIKGKGFTAIFYNSSKFVIQGKEVSSLVSKLAEKFPQFRNFATGETSKQKSDNDEIVINHSTYIGTDESGKGDFFGPLVVAGVLINKKNRQIFEELGIQDSKTLKDDKMLKMAQVIKKHSTFSVIAVSNSKYNELYSKFKNLNKLLAWGHARVIENILEKEPCKFALSDKFGDESLIKNALMKNGRTIELEQRTKAERDLAVAAASVLARATFIEKMKSMENFYGVTFPKGCNNIVKNSAKTFIEKYGKDRLKEVSKAHFKTFNEV